MFTPPFYNKHIRNITLVFGTLFNNIHIVRRRQDESIINQVKVPLDYGPKEKFIARTDEREDLDDAVRAITLPRMAFEWTTTTFDEERKLNKFKYKTLNSIESDNSKRTRIYTGVPYKFGFTLSVLTNTRDDMLQIVEQILPYFTPSFNLTINPISSLGSDITQDIKITLTSVNHNDDFEGEFETIRTLITDIEFEVTAYLLGNVNDEAEVIKTAIIQYNDLTTEDEIKEIQYAVTPPSAEKDDAWTVTVTETFGWETS